MSAPPSLVDLAERVCQGADTAAKHLELYELYAQYLSGLRDEPITLLELGVHNGYSLRVWSAFFPRAQIIGLDRADPGPDLTDCPNVTYVAADQADVGALEALCAAHAPGGLDVVIDDASHLGWLSAISHAALFDHLKPGGLYVVEDWGTGYFDDWPDGGHYQRTRVEPHDDQIPTRLPSHDFGMVGFLKGLVDEVAGTNVRPTLAGAPTREDTVEYLHVHRPLAVLKKRSQA